MVVHARSCSALAALGFFLAGCGSTPLPPYALNWDDAGTAGTEEAGASEPTGSLVSDAALAATGDCPPSAKLIYVVGVQEESEDAPGQLYSFDPDVGVFTLIGSMSCLSSPTHMTVDREGTAWVVSAGQIYRTSTADASCTRVSTWQPDMVNFPDFALTFLGTTSATDNVLYLLGNPGMLGAFDVSTGVVTHIGQVALSSTLGDMTTNGDGTLYFLMATASQTLNELDPDSGAVLRTWSTGEDAENSQALAYYGGRFFDFIGNAVFTYDTATSTVSSIGTAPIFVTGAGQSTCVPTDAGPPALLK
jgi:hypothetical protein